MYKNYISLPFDDLLSEYLINFDSSSAGIDWITKDLISLRKRIKSGTISLDKWNLVLQGAFLKVGIPLYHNYAFSVVLESRDINYLERLGRIIFGIFEFKRKALAIPCELQDEIIYGLTNNNDAYIQMWNFNRQIDEHGEERYQIRKKTPNSENLKIAVVCFDKIFKIEVDLSNNIQQVIRSLEKIVDVAYHQNSACKTGGNELTYLTYLPRPEFMDILKRDDQLKQAWLKIQNCDFAVSIFPDIRSDDLNHADPVQGAMAFLRHTPKGGILGDKNTLACFADSLACFVFDHVTIDGSPATWFASQTVQISNRISCYENRQNLEELKIEILYPLTTLKESSKTGVLNGKNFCNLLTSRGRESRHLITDELSRNLAQKYDFSIDALVQVAIHMAADKLFEVTKMEHLKYAVAVAGVRQFQHGRLVPWIARSPSMEHFLRAVKDKNRKYSDEELAIKLRNFSKNHKIKIKRVKHNPIPLQWSWEIMCDYEDNKRLQRCYDLESAVPLALEKFLEKIENDNTPAICKATVLQGGLISNGTCWPGLISWTTSSQTPWSIGYVSFPDHVDMDIFWKEMPEKEEPEKEELYFKGMNTLESELRNSINLIGKLIRI